ncbi:MAG: hypothetical protein LQ342_001806 [Letrouitia transgressa]|nr:MAG: hypothetical protein LQ342_001806 [Letrouitia transgressa]
MHFVDLGVALALLAFAAANPIDIRAAKGDFIVHQTVRKPFIKSGPAALLSTYGKYNATPPEDVVKAAVANDGTVTTTPEQYDSEYLTPVTIGGQTLNLDFDTGSSDLWVFSSELPASQSNGHSVYNPSRSSTAKIKSGYTWKIQYGDGSGASGNVYTDTVKVGTTTVTNQAVELAQQISAQFQQDIDNDGLLGLAFDSINTVQPTKQKTFFSNAKPSLSAPLFTANLKKGKPGSYTFGYIDAAQHSGAITYVPVNSANGFWEFTSNGYAVGSGSFVSTSIDSIADTGTTLLYLPQSVVTAYYSKVSGARYDSSQGGYTFACSATLPSITLGIGSYRAVVPGSYVNYAPVSSTTCFGGIQANTGIGFSIFGDIFLKSQFVVFNGGSPLQLGVGPKTL